MASRIKVFFTWENWITIVLMKRWPEESSHTTSGKYISFVSSPQNFLFVFFPLAKVHLQFNLRRNVQSYNSGFFSVEDEREFSYHYLQLWELKMFQKIIICNDCFLQLSRCYFPWCLLSTPKISPAFLQFFTFSKVQRNIPTWSWETLLLFKLSCNTECQLSPNNLRKTMASNADSLRYSPCFQRKDANWTKHSDLKFKLYISCRTERLQQGLYSYFNLLQT